MKRWATLVLLVLWLASLVSTMGVAYGSSALQGFSDEELLEELTRRVAGGQAASQDSGGSILAKATDKLSTRSGPSTAYRETGTYNVIGESIRILTRFDDHGGVCWVQCDIMAGSTYRRLYTGIKRFDTSQLDITNIPLERPMDVKAKVLSTSKAMYGPGGNYGTYDSLTVDKGQTVTLITIEDGYAQVEWTTTKQSYRAWVPVQTLQY